MAVTLQMQSEAAGQLPLDTCGTSEKARHDHLGKPFASVPGAIRASRADLSRTSVTLGGNSCRTILQPLSCCTKRLHSASVKLLAELFCF